VVDLAPGTGRELDRWHAAVRAVADEVTKGSGEPQLLESVVREARQLVGADSCHLYRAGSGDSLTLVASDGDATTLPHVASTADLAELGLSAQVPVVVEGAPWGSLVAVWSAGVGVDGASLRAFAATASLAIAWSEARNRARLLTASRLRLLTAEGAARTRLERQLHSIVQQRLIAIGLELQRVRPLVSIDEAGVHAGLDEIEHRLESALDDLRDFSRELDPATSLRTGLGGAVRVLARRSPIPVDVQIEVAERSAAPIEAAVFHVVSEALANAVKHSRASAISVVIETHAPGPSSGLAATTNLRASITDDGIGGATPQSGLSVAFDRIDALGGQFVLESEPGNGTSIRVDVPAVAAGV
jgi:signal transduction histidine kinase